MSEDKSPLRKQDEVFLKQVRSLMNTVRLAREEAEQYAEDIKDPDLRKQAEEELDKD